MSVRLIPAIAAATVFASASAVAQVKWDFPTPYADREVLTKNTVQFAEDVTQCTERLVVALADLTGDTRSDSGCRLARRTLGGGGDLLQRDAKGVERGLEAIPENRPKVLG